VALGAGAKSEEESGFAVERARRTLTVPCSGSPGPWSTRARAAVGLSLAPRAADTRGALLGQPRPVEHAPGPQQGSPSRAAARVLGVTS
jgi:hypothetical protein